MSARELDRAGVRDPALRAAYERCRRLNATHGQTYFLATRMLAPAQRPAVHALYGFARWVDDVVDDLDPEHTVRQRHTELDGIEHALQRALADGTSEHAVLAALVDTVTRYGIAPEHLTTFMAAMRQDLTVTDYPDRAALRTYVRGSAEAIGLQVLPILGTVGDPATAAPHAAALGNAFQLTNFLRDVGEDLQRGRVYLPADELAAFDVDRDRLWWCLHHRRPDRNVRRALADQVARTREVYRRAAPGIDQLHPISRPCVETAYTLYGEILDRVVESGYDVFSRRIAVPRPRRVGVAVAAVLATTTARGRALAGSAVSHRSRGRMAGQR